LAIGPRKALIHEPRRAPLCVQNRAWGPRGTKMSYTAQISRISSRESDVRGQSRRLGGLAAGQSGHAEREPVVSNKSIGTSVAGVRSLTPLLHDPEAKVPGAKETLFSTLYRELHKLPERQLPRGPGDHSQCHHPGARDLHRAGWGTSSASEVRGAPFGWHVLLTCAL
jgi:hypothetical protein